MSLKRLQRLLRCHWNVALRSIKLIFTFLIFGSRDHFIIFICMDGFLLIHPNYMKSIFKRRLQRLHKNIIEKACEISTSSHFISIQKVLPDFTEKTVRSTGILQGKYNWFPQNPDKIIYCFRWSINLLNSIYKTKQWKHMWKNIKFIIFS